MTEHISLQIFNQLYTDYHPRFVRFANSYVRNTSVAEDIVTEAFIVFWENRENLYENSNLPAYILTIVRNRCLNHLKETKIHHQALSNIQEHAAWELDMRISTLEACDPQALFSEEVQKIINDTLALLPQKTLDVFVMSRYKNMSHKEIAQALDISTKGVEFHITKALSLLRKSLKDYVFVFLLLFFFENH
ncbi:RNA polymerase sigma-70 factor [Dysgonomonas sp. 511]|uniref:RNA polymerase sigma-70 factor n=1 Tax=Dysgonomonas sp. 511 TaxID=2302930 RepID=UPI0013D707F4|nr:RNA polymerase sigma-70 factor [Dysgonomonas sp. 511]NDV77969.1 RNA polymerase sigma-70 factor [Dysgonomonas sp. 511]